ncbi:hypothetical protein BN7_4008 [Wickerhamomyces ciferrii]|uniref:Atos-like conserved domain-containing protein n=1 Tax=Wickerhamomyces ciferrii (strain ATCC 14091 / BCRC 22168 / CBS 111 / JCM 3599 / NBRC 0793 / NRRL Y-1031 F-60-10) TaxID=1206466 RepID=K0KSU3_WICCF|nr:uncharacterized protein BN7_4008 [Wickerhamomyces ciferrii]CCH44444.1 hypothetical protein BN7_4008 [Wickerhamomyces ciferrii]
MPVSTNITYDYAPRRKSSLSHITTDDILPDHEIPKKCFRCDVKSTKFSHCIRKPSRSCNSLLGSMQESLLRGTTSGSPSKPMQFGSMITAGAQGTPIKKDFDAVFYTWEDGSESPYVGSIKIGDEDRVGNKKSGFPGIKIDERGKIQVVVCNSEESPIKVILVNYNIRRLKSGYRVFIRQSNDAYTIHLNFINCKGKFYLFDEIKVIFYNHINIEHTLEDRLVGKPSKVDLNYYLNKCCYCDDELNAMNDDDSWEDVNSLTSRVSSLEMIRDEEDDETNNNDNSNDGPNIEFKFKKDYQIQFLDDDKKQNQFKLNDQEDQITPKTSTATVDVNNKNNNINGYEFDDDNSSGLLVMGTQRVN